MRKILTIIFLVLVIISNAAEFQIVSDVKELKGDLSAQRYPYKDVNGQWCAILKVHTDIKDLQFESMGYEKHDYRGEGIYLVYLQSDTKNLKFKKESFIPKNHNFHFKLKSNSVYMLELKGIGEENKIEDIVINIIGEPKNSVISIDGVEKGNITSLKTSVGKHELKVSKGGYQTYTTTIDVSPDKTMFKYGLNKVEDAVITIDSNPSGAMVYIDDVKIDKTPISTFYPPGKYKIKLISDNYEDVEEDIIIKGTETKKNYQLTDIRASLTINTHEKAKVFLNGKQITNFKNLKLTPQQCLVRVEMNKAEPLEERFILKKKENRTIDLFPDIPTGKVQVAVIPSDARIELWENGGEKYINTGSKSFDNVPVGTYNLKVSKKGFKSQKEIVRLQADALEKRSIKLEEGNDIGENYVFVKGGTFQMGSNRKDDQKPIHNITIDDFYIGKYEVTVDEFRKFVTDTNYKTDAEKNKGAFIWINNKWEQKLDANWKNPYFSQTDNHPVTCISWNDAVAYCEWLSKKEGAIYRLPTEAEWEFAARGGTLSRNYLYSGSENIDDVAWYTTTTNNSGTRPVGIKKANELCIFDMSGNVWEWCSDRYEKNYYKSSSDYNPKGALSGTNRVLRGGGWGFLAENCTVSERNSDSPAIVVYYYGFRLVRRPD